MISKASFLNFKCLKNVEVDLDQLTVLVGANGSGKSSILQGIDLLCKAFRDDYRRHEIRLRQSVSREGATFVQLAADVEGQAYRLLVSLKASKPNGQGVSAAQWNGSGRGVASDLTATTWKMWKTNEPLLLPESVLLRLESSRLAEPAAAAPDGRVMAPDGSGLHTSLASMALNNPDSWQALQANLRKIIPTIRRLRHATPANVHQPAALLFDTIGGDSLLADQMSEGTLLVLGLLAALHASTRPTLVLFDDLDRGLHPKAQRELIALLRGVLETNKDLQIVATTHSPYMLDSMTPNEVRMTFLRDDGATVCAPLASHPKFEQWKDEMSPGEMWSLFGEKWLSEQEVPA